MKAYELKVTLVADIAKSSHTIEEVCEDILRLLRNYEGAHVGHARVDKVTDLHAMRVEIRPVLSLVSKEESEDESS